MLELVDGRMVPMKCAWSARATLLLSLMIIVFCLTAIITKKPMVVAIVVVAIACILMTIDTPVSIGICMKADMDCHTTAAWIRVSMAIVCISTIAGFILDPKRKKVVD